MLGGYTLRQVRAWALATARDERRKALDWLLLIRGSQADKEGWRRIYEALRGDSQ